MEYSDISMRCGYPFGGYTLNKLKNFLTEMDLTYDEGIEFTVCLFNQNDEIIATGSLEGNVLKCIAVLDTYQGEGLTAKIITRLMDESYNNNQYHLFLFTKPKNQVMFTDFGFYPIISTADVLFMENINGGIVKFIESLESPYYGDEIGAIVVNCNPFTRGHQYLIETASKQCDLLHVFVLSENKSIFPTDVRLELVRKGLGHLKNVIVHETSDYLISSATFPSYFIKDKENVDNINCSLDLTIFYEYFVRGLKLKKRFVGTEPFCRVTNAYNKKMVEYLNRKGIEVTEIPRYKVDNIEISASRVRKLIAEDNYDEIEKIVPKTTYDFLISERGQEIAKNIKSN